MASHAITCLVLVLVCAVPCRAWAQGLEFYMANYPIGDDMVMGFLSYDLLFFTQLNHIYTASESGRRAGRQRGRPLRRSSGGQRAAAGRAVQAAQAWTVC